MTSHKTIRNLLSLLALAVGVTACGGGGDLASGGTGGTGISAGAITGFGSVVVNGVEFDTGSATITRDDSPIQETELREGMVVEVRGSIASSTSGTASTVEVEEAVRGPVEQAFNGTGTTGTLIVLGQTVRLDDTTLVDDSVCDPGDPCATAAQMLAAIDVNDVVEVHGLRGPTGEIAASFIEGKTEPVEFSLRGVATNHNDGAATFQIANLTVDYASAIIGDMPAPLGSNWNGLFVEAKGSCTVRPVCGTLTATKVEPEGLDLADADEAEIEGFVTALVSTSDFTVNSQRVVTTGSAVFLGGLQDDIVLGVKLEVEGSLAGGVLTASKVKFKDSVRIESNASVSGATITLDGLPGVTVTANAFTDFKGSGATASDLSVYDGKSVRIRGRASGASSVIASEIEDGGPSDPNADVELQGNATDVANPTFRILGVSVDTSSLVDNADFQDANDNPITRSAFFAAITPNGGLVKAKGRLPGVGGNVLAAGALDEVELED
jgi:hypothetical protein